MLAKLMSRKKSYERLMRNGDDSGATRSPAGPIPDLSSAKKHVGDMMIGNRANGLSRAQANSSTRKQLQYYDSTPMASKPRKHPQSVKKQAAGGNGGSTLKNTAILAQSNMMEISSGGLP